MSIYFYDWNSLNCLGIVIVGIDLGDEVIINFDIWIRLSGGGVFLGEIIKFDFC